MRRTLLLLAGVAFAAAACDQAPMETTPETTADAPAFKKVGGSSVEAQMRAMLDEVNATFASEGVGYRAVMVEYVTGDGDEAGATVLSKDVGNKQLDFDFVPFDPRRAGTPITNGGWSGSVDGPTDDITYAVDQLGGAIDGLTQEQTNAAIDAAMATWEGRSCSDLPLTKNPDFGVPLGVLAGGFLVADVMHAGWDKVEFDGGTLGATFTFGFCDPCDGPDFAWTDINNDGKRDTAWREIYYDPFSGLFGPPWPWTTDGTGIDVETVALHEVGHGLSQAHFGNIFFQNTGAIQRAPAAVMNPFIFGVDRVLYGTDNGGHCSIWAEWPNN